MLKLRSSSLKSLVLGEFGKSLNCLNKASRVAVSACLTLDKELTVVALSAGTPNSSIKTAVGVNKTFALSKGPIESVASRIESLVTTSGFKIVMVPDSLFLKKVLSEVRFEESVELFENVNESHDLFKFPFRETGSTLKLVSLNKASKFQAAAEVDGRAEIIQLGQLSVKRQISVIEEKIRLQEVDIKKVESEIEQVSVRIVDLESILMKHPLWTDLEILRYGNIENLRSFIHELRKKETELRKEKTELRKKETELRKKETELRREKSLKDDKQNELKEKVPTPEVILPTFDVSSEKGVSFHFLPTNGETFLPIIARDDLLQDIKSFLDRLPRPKFSPLVISTTRGLGKSFFLKKLAMQDMKDHLRSNLIGDAKKYGRIISFDFSSQLNAVTSTDDCERFFTLLMIHHLCELFDGRRVDNINFCRISFSSVKTYKSTHESFNTWHAKFVQYPAYLMIMEYIRLTDIAYGVQCKAKPVFLLDEIQNLAESPTTVRSKLNHTHTLLSYLLTQLSISSPICICTGTKGSSVELITDRSSFNPIILHMKPFILTHRDLYYETMIYFTKKEQGINIDMKPDSNLMLLNALTLGVPRLLNLSFTEWFILKKAGVKDPAQYISSYRKSASSYYSEITKIMQMFSIDDLCHIFMCCGVHWPVEDVSSNVPGTSITWENLISNCYIFPTSNGSYVFPFDLVWENTPDDLRKEIIERCSCFVKDLNIEDLFITFNSKGEFDDLSQHSEISMGYRFERLFVASIATKYYIYKLVYPNKYPKFSDLYDFGTEDVSRNRSKSLLKNIVLNLSDGIHYPEKQENITKRSVIHNRTVTNSHHDVILKLR